MAKRKVKEPTEEAVETNVVTGDGKVDGFVVIKDFDYKVKDVTYTFNIGDTVYFETFFDEKLAKEIAEKKSGCIRELS